ncbi:NAD-dependent epimerase/dehydratase family protein [Promicromonospora citrea]|uniref:NAD-dependent dehydratase n=1 Tax=Promicromonospora citrea TaxID=43677 RepID=A0A8H9GHE0_9MICO|nr:NAD-dependent epimerase/dehydratase family protein [Promicromonospora citrea]NNH54796.1 NAD-dependent epimerase/dehydratase family protein [Promicromonospora citrea]GGM27817.1 NAD-dependent dehydratase [Promicromonospora citrea]
MRVLVTGGAGFIGREVVAELTRHGDDVVVLDSLRPDVHGPAAVSAEEPADGRVLVGDVRDPDAVGRALAGCDAVVHLAAKVGLGVSLGDIDDYVSSNDLGTAVLLRAARVPHVVYASSMVVYGEGRYDCAEHGQVAPPPRRTEDLDAGLFEPRCPVCGEPLRPGLVTEDARLDPRNVYAATKAHGEALHAAWARQTGGSATALRFHNVYGPGMPRDTPYAGVAALFRAAVERGEAPTVLEDGQQRRDFVHVTDVARAVAAAAHAPQEPGTVTPFNVGSGVVTTVGEMAQVTAKLLAGPDPVVTGGYRLGDVRHVTASSEAAAAALGWRARVGLEEGLATLT